jgi:branched-chain amino acid transport system substrate-binding protein
MKQADHRVLKIGAIFMTSGGVAQLGKDSYDGCEVARQLVNDEGGVRGRRIEWITADGATPQQAARAAEIMIDQGVRVIVGCYGSNHTIEVSKVCERKGAVLFAQTAWTASLFDHKPRFTFRANTYARPVEQAAVAYVVSHLAPRLKANAKQLRMMVINEGSAYGLSCGDETVAALLDAGFSQVPRFTYDAKYDGASVDADTIARKVAEYAPDVLFASSFVHDAVAVLKALKKHDCRPPAIMTSSAGFGLYTLLAAGELTEGIFSANAPALVNSAALNERGLRLKREYLNRLTALTGREPTGFNSMSFCVTYGLLRDVLDKVATPEDPHDVRTAAMATDVPLGSYPNGWGLRFDSSGQNTRCPPCIDQWQSGQLVTVEPAALATGVAL